jgi:plastocyanin
MGIGRLLVWLFILPLFGLGNFSEAYAPKTHMVLIKEMKFVPAAIAVKKGDVVVWINRDIVVHNVTEEKSKAWASPAIAAGKSWKMVIKQSSVYFCSLHPVMKGEIQVQ